MIKQRPLVFVPLAVFASTSALVAPSRAQDSPPGASPAPASPTVVVVDERPRHHLFGDADHRSPGLAAILSLTPVPVDFGNFYAENVDWGLVYTTGELALAGGMMWLGASHMCHTSDGCGSWSAAERNGMVGLGVGYVALKIIAAVHAASAARDFNEEARFVPTAMATSSGAVLGIAAVF